jgi:hypothetical protein
MGLSGRMLVFSSDFSCIPALIRAPASEPQPGPESSLDLSLATELGLAPETDKNQRKYHIENHNLCPKTPSPAAGGELKRKAC